MPTCLEAPPVAALAPYGRAGPFRGRTEQKGEIPAKATGEVTATVVVTVRIAAALDELSTMWGSSYDA